MRKLVWLILVVLLVFLGNFALWFMNTRMIEDTINSFKKELSYNNFNMEYKEIKFTNFKSWRVGVVIEDLKIYNANNTVQSYELSFPHVEMVVLPWEKELKIKFKSIPHLVSKDKFYMTNYALVSQPEQYTEVEFKFYEDISDLAAIFANPDARKLALIKHLTLHVPQTNLMDESTNSQKASIEGVDLDLNTESADEFKKFQVDLIVKNFIVNRDFVSSNEDALAHKLSADLGNTNFKLAFDFIQQPSKEQLELLNSEAGKKANLKKVMDSYTLDLKELNYTSEVYNGSVKGNAYKTTNMLVPNMNFVIDIEHYKNMINHHVDGFNNTVKLLNAQNPLLNVKPVSDAQRARIVKFFEEFAVNEDNLRLTVNKDEGEVYISGKSLMTVLMQLSEIMGDTPQAVPLPKKK